MLFQIILTFHILIAIGLVSIILMQHGKGASAGAAFGGGSSNSVFGATGSGSFLYKLTKWLGVAFFSTSLTLAYIAASDASPDENSEIESIIQATDIPELPVAPVSKDLGVPTLNQ